MSHPSLYDPSFEHDACGVGMIADLAQRSTHATVSDALTILENLRHRGASGSDEDSGDGAGILVDLPDAFLRAAAAAEGIALAAPHCYGVGVWFVLDDGNATATRARIDETFQQCGLVPVGWRRIPTTNALLGDTARSCEPQQWMHFLHTTDPVDPLVLERQLYVARRLASKNTGAYAASCSSRTLVYKGMLTSRQLRPYFDDLRDPALTAAIAVVHGRFSTNTFPSWALAQPFRLIAHNGEINTIRSNRNWMKAREAHLKLDAFGSYAEALVPVVTPGLSDSASFDEVCELLTLGGRDIAHAILMMIPEAWERATDMDEALRDFYRFHAALMEPWDGPASVTFCDGTIVGAVLDRNGLRPARYYVTSDDRVILASEVGVLGIPDDAIVRKGRLQPGRIFLVDTSAHRIIDDHEVKDVLAHRAPYGDWLRTGQRLLDELPARTMLVPEHDSVRRQQVLFGYSAEDLDAILAPMALHSEEPIGSMGSDTPPPVLSQRIHSVFDFFSQQFAQVTNPPLDALREELVTATRVAIGPQSNLLAATPQHCRQIVLSSPILSLEELAKLRYIHELADDVGLRAEAFDGFFHAHSSDPAAALVAGLDDLEDRVMAAVEEGANVIILSDRNASNSDAPIPSLLATAAVHHRLVAAKWRSRVALVIEAGDAREVHHMALLLGYGASAVSPYLALDSLSERASSIAASLSPTQARLHYVKALTKGVLKVMSKMGVSTVASYIGSELFEPVGLGDDVLARCFPGTVSRIGGRSLGDVARDVLIHHAAAFAPSRSGGDLAPSGDYQWRRDGELHLFNPRTVFKLQHATREKRMDIFRDYSRLVNDQARDAVTLRSLFTLVPAGPALALEDVEPVTRIFSRFATGAMSYGSISAEAHETLAIAMNRLGGKSNTGEGGEDPERLVVTDPRFNRRSAIKQVASARFGVTMQYLVHADDLQIKIAQGAKPGEGGQLPGAKVHPWIAKTRLATPGVGLISPPPHHDIYSIEDLAQLIFDLKNANSRARVSVKLVAEAGVGTVAAGVAKAHADVILISGHDGGTGAAPLTSLKHAGTPWEIGLAETQQTLALNGLRDRVILQVDGQLKTGRDVVIAALLGAEEYGFATAPLVVSGCVMMRVCHLDTCPVGIASQNPELRKRFTGQPEFVENFFEFLATEVREILAELGLASLDEAIGRTDLLSVDTDREGGSGTLSLARLVHPPTRGQSRSAPRENNDLSHALDWQFCEPAVRAALRGDTYEFVGPIANTDRTTGTLTGSELVRRQGDDGGVDDTITLRLTGSAGQSLGAFLPRGMTIRINGDANDYVGKGLSGGRIIIRPSEHARFPSEDNVIIGNVAGYGATAGEIFVRGIAGERLGVRNSGATIVVEGAGDHACEYMTGGTVIILGDVGQNLAAGMSGGTVYFHDPRQFVGRRLSAGSFEVDPLEVTDDHMLRGILRRYLADTGSCAASRLLATWSTARMDFVKVESSEYRRAMERNTSG